jgi:polysaccharide transporter, PST family
MSNAGGRSPRSSLLHNIAALFGVQICRKAAPFVVLPYLAAVLGPSGLGIVAFAQAIGDVLGLFIEFGFNISATREIARNRDDRSVCGEVASGVLGAQVTLAIAGVVILLLSSRFLFDVGQTSALISATIFYGLTLGFTPLWALQGFERMKSAALLEAAGKALGVCGVFLFVHSPEDTWKALLLQASTPVVSMVGGLWLTARMVPFHMPSWRLVAETLQGGWNGFVLRSGITLFATSNVLLLGLLAPPHIVGYYAIGEKISKATFGLLQPIREGLFPRLSLLVGRSPQSAARLFRYGVLATAGGGLFLSIGLYLFADAIVEVMANSEFDEAVRVLHILSVLPFVIALTDSIGLQWLLPHGRVRVVSTVILCGAVLNTTLALSLAPRFQHIGMAWGVVVSEIFVSCVLMLIVWRAISSESPRTAHGTEAQAGLRAAQ